MAGRQKVKEPVYLLPLARPSTVGWFSKSEGSRVHAHPRGRPMRMDNPCRCAWSVAFEGFSAESRPKSQIC